MNRIDDAYGRIEALPIHSIYGYEWDCANCHFHYRAADGFCGGCGLLYDEAMANVYADALGEPCDHGAMLDRDAVLQAISAAAEA